MGQVMTHTRALSGEMQNVDAVLTQNPISPIYDIDWKEMCAVRNLKPSSNSVFLIEIKDRGALVLKSSDLPCNCLFAHMAMGYIEMFKVPQMRVLVHVEKEYEHLTNRANELLAGHRVLRGQLVQALQRPYLLIMEYVPGFTFEKMQRTRSAFFLHPDLCKGFNTIEAEGLGLDAVGQSLRTSYHPESPLIILGKIIATDIVLNNPDRIPSIWKNDGNPGNIHVEISLTPSLLGRDDLLTSAKNLEYMNMLNVVSIDCQSYPMRVRTAPNLENYMAFLAEVEKFVVELLRDLRIFRSHSSWSKLQVDSESIALEHMGANIKPLNELEWGCFTRILKFLENTTGNQELFGAQSRVKGRVCL